MCYLLTMHSRAIEHNLTANDRHLGDRIAQILERASQRI
jgi:hypothetical protein